MKFVTKFQKHANGNNVQKIWIVQKIMNAWKMFAKFEIVKTKIAKTEIKFVTNLNVFQPRKLAKMTEIVKMAKNAKIKFADKNAIFILIVQIQIGFVNKKFVINLNV